MWFQIFNSFNNRTENGVYVYAHDSKLWPLDWGHNLIDGHMARMPYPPSFVEQSNETSWLKLVFDWQRNSKRFFLFHPKSKGKKATAMNIQYDWNIKLHAIQLWLMRREFRLCQFIFSSKSIKIDESHLSFEWIENWIKNKSHRQHNPFQNFCIYTHDGIQYQNH